MADTGKFCLKGHTFLQALPKISRFGISYRTFTRESGTYPKYADNAYIENLRAHDLRHRFSYRMAERVPLHRLAQIMGRDSLDTTMLYVRGTQRDLQQVVETIAWQ